MTKEQKDKLSKSFALGFMVSREGFNGECDYEHLAPSRLEPHCYSETIEMFIDGAEGIETNSEFRRLRGEALVYLDKPTKEVSE